MYSLKEYIKYLIPDTLYLKILYKKIIGKNLDLKNPQTFNEKLQWLKLHDRNPEYTKLVDKYEVKKIVAERIGEEYIIPTLGIWEKFEEIDFDSLPARFVLKCTHDSGSVIICNDKKNFDLESARKIIETALKKNFYWKFREWPYKNIKPRIIAEELLSDVDERKSKCLSSINDYKFECFEGTVDNILVCTERMEGSGAKYNYFSKSWDLLPYSIPEKAGKVENCKKPENLKTMIQLAELLSQGLKQVRVDFYEVSGKIYFGEYTFFSNAGFDVTITPEADKILGDKLKI